MIARALLELAGADFRAWCEAQHRAATCSDCAGPDHAKFEDPPDFEAPLVTCCECGGPALLPLNLLSTLSDIQLGALMTGRTNTPPPTPLTRALLAQWEVSTNDADMQKLLIQYAWADGNAKGYSEAKAEGRAKTAASTPQPEPRKPLSGVYAIRDTSTGHVKIGKSGDARTRMAKLQTASATKLELVCMLSDSQNDEDFFHRLFADHRACGEWFHPNPTLSALILDRVAKGTQ